MPGRPFAHFVLFALFVGLCPSAHAGDGPSGLAAFDLRVEYREAPLGIDSVTPRLGWKVHSSERAQRQTAYQILVASSPERLANDEGDLWDTGRVRSDETLHVVYDGVAMESRMRAFWKVRVWDRRGRASGWSAPSKWSVGLLKPSDWEANWIGHDVGYFKGDQFEELHLPPSPYLRTEFQAEKPVKRATLYVSALGLYEMRLNGQRVGDAYFTPGWTDYDKRVYYQTYDVTGMIQTGANALGAVLADGWYAGYVGYSLFVARDIERVRGYWGEHPALLAQLELEYEDGTRSVHSSQSSRHARLHGHLNEVWTATTGPLREADILMGESYDARLEADIKGWDRPAFDDSSWRPVRWRPPADGRLAAFPGVPVQIQEEIKPVSLREVKPGVFVYDLGKNFAGVVELRVTGPAGAKVRLRFAEMLHSDGTVMTDNLRAARATDFYTLKGGGEEVWRPQFTYHGFQYVEVTGYPGRPTLESIVGLRLNSSTPKTGEIRIEKDIDWGGTRGLVTQLFENIKTTQFANFFEVPTDCPQRDERLGWTGDAQVYVNSAAYIADVSAFFVKWLADLRDGQRWYGAYPTFVPKPFSRVFEYSPAWMDAGVIIPYYLFRHYGDTRLLRTQWDSMRRFMAFQKDAAGADFLRPGAGQNYGDWLAVGRQTGKDFLAAAYFGYDAKLMAEMARALGDEEAAAEYEALFRSIKSAFARAYIGADGKTADDTQTSYAVALAMDLYPEHLKEAGAARLAELVAENDGKLATGFLGVRHLLPVLSEFGYDDLAYGLLTETGYPSWGYEVVNGATSIWERWNSYTVEDGFLAAKMNSFSHYAFGSVAEWMFAEMGGIQPAEAGFKSFRIQPRIAAAPFDGVETTYDSIRGRIRSYWQKQGDHVRLQVTVPANTRAEVFVPAKDRRAVREGGLPATRAEGVKFRKMSGAYAVFEVGSGDYAFVSEAALN